MNKALWGASLLGLCAGAAGAAGLDRSGQNIAPIFGNAGTAGVSLVFVQPSVTGDDALGNDYDVGESYTAYSLSWTHDINEAFSYSVILDQPYGANVDYNNDPTTSTLGGTGADLGSDALTLLGRYKTSVPGLSIHGGISLQRITAEVMLNGTAYANAISVTGVTDGFNAGLPPGAPSLDSGTLGAALAGDPAAAALIDGTYGAGTTAALGGTVAGTVAAFNANDGYDFDMEESVAVQPVIGMAYEIPDIAFRLSGTYFFETEHGADTEENLLGATTDGDVEFVAPQALNIDFQTGIATDTLLLASYRWSQYSAVDLVPDRLGSDLVNLDDGRRWTLGLGRRFSDEWSGSVTYLFEPEGEDDLVSPLGPTNGLQGITVGTRYASGGLTATAGFNYSMLGDARAEVGGREAASFEDNSSTAIGFSLTYEF